MASLVPTGERTAPGLPREEYWFARHEAAYAALPHLLGDLLADATVIDAGTGEGYGAHAIAAAGARSVVALEYDETTCIHAAATYTDIEVVRANLDALPLQDAIASAVVSCQVIEHLWDLPRFLRECRRVLRPLGLIIVTTPNRLTFSPGLDRGQRPINPFHVEEFDADQIVHLLNDAGFVDARVLALHHGPRLREWEGRHGSIVAAQVDAVLSGAWPDGLHDMVSSVTLADFELTESDIDAGADLIGIARVAP